MPPDALVPDDPRVQHEFIKIKGTEFTYHYKLAKPLGGKPRATALLLHGFPDIGLGWRYQVPYLLSLNLQVIIPDMLGYGRTSAPDAAEEYSFKKMSDHMAYIIREIVPEQRVILGGHDWGGFMAWRLAMWYPELFLCVFSLAVHFTPPNREYIDLEKVAKIVPTLKYHQQFADPDLERALQEPREIRNFLDASYKNASQVIASRNAQSQGLSSDLLKSATPTPLMSKELMDFYVEEFLRHGMHAPFNWYRTRKYNYDDELVFSRRSKVHSFSLPAMCIMARYDVALPPEQAQKQRKYFDELFVQETFDCGHWIGIEKPQETNKAIGDFIERILVDSTDKSKL